MGSRFCAPSHNTQESSVTSYVWCFYHEILGKDQQKTRTFWDQKKKSKIQRYSEKLQKLQLLFSDYSLDLGVAISPGLAVEADGALLVADRGNARLMRIREGG